MAMSSNPYVMSYRILVTIIVFTIIIAIFTIPVFSGISTYNIQTYYLAIPIVILVLAIICIILAIVMVDKLRNANNFKTIIKYEKEMKTEPVATLKMSGKKMMTPSTPEMIVLVDKSSNNSDYSSMSMTRTMSCDSDYGDE